MNEDITIVGTHYALWHGTPLGVSIYRWIEGQLERVDLFTSINGSYELSDLKPFLDDRYEDLRWFNPKVPGNLRYYLMYEIGECNDSLRDRYFYHVKAASEQDAHRQIWEHEKSGYDQTLEDVHDMWGIFVSSETPITVPNPCELDDRNITDLT
jgi:hypothetical protein